MTTRETKPNNIYAFQPEDVEAVFQTVAMGFHNKIMTFNEFREYLKDLMLVDRQGTLWTIGAGSGSWYRRDGESWTQATPSGDLFSVHRVIRGMQGVMPECPKCHSRVPRKYQFCPHCATPIGEPAQAQIPVPEVKPKPVDCQKCGKPVKPSAKFCTTCGAPRSP